MFETKIIILEKYGEELSFNIIQEINNKNYKEYQYDYDEIYYNLIDASKLVDKLYDNYEILNIKFDTQYVFAFNGNIIDKNDVFTWVNRNYE